MTLDPLFTCLVIILMKPAPACTGACARPLSGAVRLLPRGLSERVEMAQVERPGTAPPIRVTLAEAVARGMTASHRLEEFRQRRAGAEATTAGVAASDRPQVSVLAGYTRTNHVDEFGILLPTGRRNTIFPDLPNNYRARLDLQWPIYTAGRFAALERAARADLDASGHEVVAASQDLELEITGAFWSAVTAGETARVMAESTGRMEAHLQDVRNRLSIGLIPPNEVLSVEAQHSRQQVLLLEARNARALALAELARLLGVDADAPLELDAALDRAPSGPPALETLVSEARARRPDREVLVRRLAAFSARRVAAEAERRPVVTVAGGVDYARPNPRRLPRVDQWEESWDLGVNASWSLWDGGRVAADVAEMTAAERAARQRFEEFDSLLSLEVRQRRLDLESALAAIPAASAAVRSSAEARRVVGERFNAGVATSLDLLDAHVALLGAELDRTRALAAAQIAAARLERTIGR